MRYYLKRIIVSFRKLLQGHGKKMENSFDKKVRNGLHLLTILILSFILILMFPTDTSLEFADLKEGNISNRRIVAPFSFEILKTQEEYQRDCEIAEQKVHYIFIRRPKKTSDILENIDSFFNHVRIIRNAPLKSKKDILHNSDSLFIKYNISFSDSNYKDLLIRRNSKLDKQDLSQLHTNIDRIVQDIMAVGIYNIEKDELNLVDERVVIIESDEEVVRSIDEFYDFNTAKQKIIEELTNSYQRKDFLAQIGYGIISYFLEPNLIFNEQAYNERIENAVARVPRSSGFVKKNEKIVDNNERITKGIRMKLESLAAKKAESGVNSRGMKKIFSYISRFAFILLLFLFFASYIYFYNAELLEDTKSIIVIVILISIISILSFLVKEFKINEYLVPAIIFSMLLTTIFDTQIAFIGAVFISLLVGGMWGNDFNITVVSFFMSIAGVITIHRVGGRRQLVESIFILAGTYILIITIVDLLHLKSFNDILSHLPYGIIMGIFAPIITYGLLPLIESIFNLTTDYSLLELSNLNHPVLKRLSLEAPGTYHHSIIVGNLAESAAQALGANSLLARVGSYYHDIGKLEKAEYFIENQLANKSPHDKLVPRMSALILKNHVKRGVEIAKEYKIPEAVKDIIEQHHGTNSMKFFYEKALEKSSTDDDVSVEDYSYPGPKPQTKEAAIVMLADTIEAATKTMKKFTHSRLKGMIDKLIDERFNEGELDESPLTLKDLEKIKESFLTILAGTFHTRIDYNEKNK
ncbi:MAG: HDIG domain-containing protein [bacterium]